MRIAEIYASVQGEGSLRGTKSSFVRASGCNLRCRWCDTPYASWRPEGEDRSVEEILAEIEALAPRHVVITGGEPMLFAELIPLADALRARQYHITIETAGTLYLPVACDLMSISPKLSNSTPAAEENPRWSPRHEQVRHAPAVIRRLGREYTCQFKFVVDTRADCQEVERYLAEFAGEIDRGDVMLMPQGIDPGKLAATTEWLVPYCREHGLSFTPRAQIQWFGPTRGT